MKTAASLAAAYVRPEIRAINAYHVAPATGMIKLDAMENPYRLPEALRTEMGRALAEVAINRYPDASGAAVKDALRRTLKIDARWSLILGNGSDVGSGERGGGLHEERSLGAVEIQRSGMWSLSSAARAWAARPST